MLGVDKISYREDLTFIALSGGEIAIAAVSLITGHSGVFIGCVLPAIVSLWTLYKPSLGITQLNTVIHCITPVIFVTLMAREITLGNMFHVGSDTLYYLMCALMAVLISYCSYECSRKYRLGYPLLWELRPTGIQHRDRGNAKLRREPDVMDVSPSLEELGIYVPDSMFVSENAVEMTEGTMNFPRDFQVPSAMVQAAQSNRLSEIELNGPPAHYSTPFGSMSPQSFRGRPERPDQPSFNLFGGAEGRAYDLENDANGFVRSSYKGSTFGGDMPCNSPAKQLRSAMSPNYVPKNQNNFSMSNPDY